MKSFRLSHLSIATRIVLLAGLLLLVAISVMTFVSTRASTQGLNAQAKANLSHNAENVRAMAEVQGELAAAKLDSDLHLARGELARLVGGDPQWTDHLHFDRDQTRRVGSHTLPALMLGEHELTGAEAVVDAVLEKTASTCTIFHVTDERWVRVATNVKKPDGSRATGTTIERDSPVYQYVMGGKTFAGTNNILGRFYETAYQPLRNAKGAIVSVLYVGVPHDNFKALHESITSIRLGESGYVYALNSKGVFTVHPTEVGTDASDHAFIREMIEKKQGFLEYEWEGKTKYAAYAYFEPYDWIICAGAYASEFNAAAADVRNQALLLGLVVLVGAVVVLWMIGRTIGKGVQSAAQAIEQISEGDGDLTRRLPVVGKDEVARLSANFNSFVEKIHALVSSVNETAVEIASASTEVAASSEQIAANVSNQSQQTTEASGAIEEMAATVEQSSERVQAAVEAAEQAGHQAKSGQGVVDETVSSMNSIAESVGGATRLIEELGARGEEIGRVIEVINDIADQTNLLALNAAIEAARAGEHGRGFAVVADEVRKLADRTTKATEEVTESIRAIQDGTRDAVQQMRDGGSKVEAGMDRARAAGESLATIRGNSDSVVNLIREIDAASSQHRDATSLITASIESIDAAGRESSAGASQASEAVNGLSAKAEELRRMMSRFKLD